MISTESSQSMPTTPTTESSFYQRKLLKVGSTELKNKAMIKIRQIHKPLQALTKTANYLLTKSLVPTFSNLVIRNLIKP